MACRGRRWTTARPRTVLMYSHDGVGLGHMRRNATIASRLVRHFPDINILMMVGCQTGVFFDLPPRVDFIKLPSIRKVATNTWESRSLRVSKEVAGRLRANLIRMAAQSLEPDVVLVDHVPAGVWDELLPTFEALRDGPTKIVLGLRDILDAPDVVRAAWTRAGTYDVIRSHYDRVLIYGDPAIFDAAAAYGLNGALADKVRYCGYLAPEPDAPHGSEPPLRRFPGRDGFVVVTMGGGADAFPVMRTCLDAVRRNDAGDGPEVLIIAGPVMDRDGRRALKERAKGLPVRVLDWTPDAARYLRDADLVVAMGGYNTMMEAIRHGRRTVIIPRRGPSAEQRMRARLFADRGLVATLDPEEATPARLWRVLTGWRGTPPPSRPGWRFDGVESVLANFEELLGAPPLPVRWRGPAPLRSAGAA